MMIGMTYYIHLIIINKTIKKEIKMIIDYNLEYQIRNLELTLSHLYRELDYLIVLERDIDEIDELKNMK